MHLIALLILLQLRDNLYSAATITRPTLYPHQCESNQDIDHKQMHDTVITFMFVILMPVFFLLFSYNKMKASSTTKTLKKLNIDFDHSLKLQPTRQKNLQMLSLSLLDKRNKVSICTSIIQKLKDRKARDTTKDQTQSHSFVGYRDKLERKTVDLCDMRRGNRQRDIKQDFEPLMKKKKFKYGDSLKMSFIDRKQDEKSVSNYVKKEKDQNVHIRQPKQEDKDVTINPYTRSQYKYIQNRQIDSFLSIRHSVSLKKVRNSITNSYKVASIHLNPPSKQKYSLKLIKKVYQWKDTPKQKYNHEDSVIQPWQWTADERMDVS